MPNRLADQTSPYLLQHADNPVDWWPWSQAALAAAKAGDKPILLSIGYAACHWCHVMAHESFEDPDIAAVMNRLFVNIKVDREERPDIDQIYMAALHALGQQGGWPLTMFLTPDGEPFWGGTYFPKTPRYGVPGFPDVLEAVARTYAGDRDRVDHNRKALIDHLQREAGAGEEPTPALLDAAVDKLSGLMDPLNGGLRGAPKFPQPGLLELLLVQGARRADETLTAKACFALDRISQGGIYDHVGGGYARYSVDERWLVPHFEKMLYDNGQLLGLLARAWTLTGDPLFRRRMIETVAWADSEMLTPDGAFAASLDADTQGEEGLTYVWTEAEIDDVLDTDAALFKPIYDVTQGGNWEGRTILNRLLSGPSRDPETEDRLARCCERLKARRDGRPQPGRDDKILADWNALMIRGLAEAGIALDRADWIRRAETDFRFVSESMADESGRLAHAFRAGRFTRPGLASDHAAMAVAALALHQATFAEAYIEKAVHFLDLLDRHYRSDDGLYFLAADDARDLILRPKPLVDEATPNHHGLIVRASSDLYLLTGDHRHLDRADRVLAAAGSAIGRNILGAASLLSAFARRLDLTTVVIVGETSDRRRDLVRASRHYLPDAVLFAAESTAGLPSGHPAQGKTPGATGAAAYVCRGAICSLPITEAEAFTVLGSAVTAAATRFT